MIPIADTLDFFLTISLASIQHIGLEHTVFDDSNRFIVVSHACGINDGVQKLLLELQNRRCLLEEI